MYMYMYKSAMQHATYITTSIYNNHKYARFTVTIWDDLG